MKRKYRYQVTYLDKKKDFICCVKFFITLYGVSSFIKRNDIINYYVIDMNTLTEVLL